MSTPVIGQVSDSILKMDSEQFDHLIETFDFYFDEIGEVSEVNKVIMEYKGAGVPNMTLQIGTRPSQVNDVTWSSPIAQTVMNGTVTFFFRRQGAAKYIRFRFAWNNTNDDYVDDLRLMSITRVEDGPDLTTK